jgi:hypothetical protein
MHMQLRNFDALEESKLQILRIRPNLRQHWLGLAVAYHMNRHLEDALEVLETFDALVKVAAISTNEDVCTHGAAGGASSTR